MKQTVPYTLPILRMIALAMALFFVVLAVFDGFEEEQDIEYVGEFLNESDFDYVDFPTSISRSSQTQTLKIQRIVVLSVFDFVSEALRLIKPSLPEAAYIPLEIFTGLDFLIGKSIAANAP
ncbi:MAG: hypothetical protein ACXIUD_02815 [Mongoliitalea sp.]